MNKPNKLLGIVDKNNTERIEIQACELEGHPFIDIRTWWRSKNEDTWKPSRKGITLHPGLVDELIAVLKKVENKGKG